NGHQCRRARHPPSDYYEKKLTIRGFRRRGAPLGNCQYLDPKLQAQRHRAPRLSHRCAAADRLRANQEPRPARAAAVELATALHNRRHIITATTDYLAASSPRQSAPAVVAARRLRCKSVRLIFPSSMTRLLSVAQTR